MPAVVGSNPIVHPILPPDLIDFFSNQERGHLLDGRPNYGPLSVRVSVNKARVSAEKRLHRIP
jgi:hypothetical protein